MASDLVVFVLGGCVCVADGKVEPCSGGELVLYWFCTSFWEVLVKRLLFIFTFTFICLYCLYLLGFWGRGTVHP